MSNLKISIATEFLGKGIKDANKSVKGLEGSVKNLGYLFGGGYLGAKVLAFSKTAVKAFAADDKAAQVLSKTLANLGLSFQDMQVSNFIADMERMYGVLDDQLRPAFQKLLTTTGSVAEAQKLLKASLDLSAAGYGDVVSVAGDLSKAYAGQTRSLAKYGLGLTQAQLKGMKFEEVLAKINKNFGGSAALVADTYAGKIDKLNVAAANVTETIGKGLVDALGKAFGGGTGDRIDNVTSKMEKLGKVGSGIINTFADVFQATFDTKAYLEQSRAGKPAYTGAIPSIQAELAKKVWEDRMKSLREEAVLSTKITNDKKKQLALDKAKAALAKAQANFDITKINLAAALKGKVSEEDRKRLLALQAIENENGELALKYISQLDYARKLAAEAEEERLRKLAEAEKARQEALLASIKARMDAIQEMMDKVQRKILANQAEAAAALAATAFTSSGGTTLLTAGSYYGDIPSNYSSPESLGLSDLANTLRNQQINVNVSLDGQAFQNAVIDATSSANTSGQYSAGYYR